LGSAPPRQRAADLHRPRSARLEEGRRRADVRGAARLGEGGRLGRVGRRAPSPQCMRTSLERVSVAGASLERRAARQARAMRAPCSRSSSHRSRARRSLVVVRSRVVQRAQGERDGARVMGGDEVAARRCRAGRLFGGADAVAGVRGSGGAGAHGGARSRRARRGSGWRQARTNAGARQLIVILAGPRATLPHARGTRRLPASPRASGAVVATAGRPRAARARAPPRSNLGSRGQLPAAAESSKSKFVKRLEGAAGGCGRRAHAACRDRARATARPCAPTRRPPVPPARPGSSPS